MSRGILHHLFPFIVLKTPKDRKAEFCMILPFGQSHGKVK